MFDRYLVSSLCLCSPHDHWEHLPMYLALQEQLVFSTRPMVPRMKNKLPKLATLFFIYQSNCFYGASYTGRCPKNLLLRAREHLPVWLTKGFVRNINSSILTHLIQPGHAANINPSFIILFCINNYVQRPVGDSYAGQDARTVHTKEVRSTASSAMTNASSIKSVFTLIIRQLNCSNAHVSFLM